MNLPVGTYSFYDQLQKCPHKAFHMYIAKTLPYRPSPQQDWGNKVHDAMQKRIKWGADLPEEMKAAEATAAVFYGYNQYLTVRVEYELAMTANGTPCGYKDNNVWFRGKLDCVVMPNDLTFGWMVDWKTGNVREDPFELETNALLLKVNHTDIREIKGEYFWMKVGQNGLRYTLNNHSETYGKLSNLRAEAETYLRAGEWPKRKSPLCGWCAVKSCEHFTGKHLEG